ncbi:MAG: PfkB family carbohydrate kinase [Chitinophagales bacterium]|nr:PfkB family carbohydrate kinase [Chitinophagales bacterium]
MDINHILQKFRAQKILVAGDVMVDVYLLGKADRISPEAPVPIVTIEKKEDRPGGAANVALNIKELGAIPILCSVIGNDLAGKNLIRILKKNKIDTSGILSSPKRITTEKTRVLSKNHQLIRYDSEITNDLNEADERNLISKITSLISKEKPVAVIFEDYNKGVLTEKVIHETITLCNSKNIFTAVDPKKKNFFAYKNVSLFKPNLREVREALKDDIEDLSRSNLVSISKSLQKKLLQQITLITLSEHGIFFSTKKGNQIIPAHKRNIADVSGAGDTVIAVATLCLACGIDILESVELANIAGGLVCQHAGVIPITKGMLLAELKK